MALKISKISKLSTPLSIERGYQTSIRKTVNFSADVIRNKIIPNLPQLVANNKVFRGDSDLTDSDLTDLKLRFDRQSVGEAIAELYVATRLTIDDELTKLKLERMAQSISLETSDWNKGQIHRVFRQALGVNLIQSDPFLGEMLQIFSINNANLIKDVSATFVNQTENLVYEGMIKGWRHEVIAKKLLATGEDELGKSSRFTVAKTRADLIGRDQINKLNGDLTHLRQIQAGITHYFWRDSNDSRVRPAHRLFNNRRFSWAKGATGGLHPGQDYQCRCWAAPDFSTFKN